MTGTIPSAPDSGRGPRPPREVVFVKYYQKGSTDIAADQMAEALQRRGVAARSIFASELGGVRGAILVFVKRIDLLDLVRTKLAGNALVVDVQDTVVFKRGVRYSRLWDGIIFRSRRAHADFAARHPGAVTIPQHWDERYERHRCPDDRLRVAFIGDPRSYPLPSPLPGVTLLFDDWFARAAEFNAHLSLRGTERERLYKPNNKISTAAACGAVLLTTRDAAAEEHLGADYPFYVGASVEEVVAALEAAERAMGGPDWRRALALLERVREDTSLERTLDRYVDYLSRFGTLRRREGATDARLDAAAVP